MRALLLTPPYVRVIHIHTFTGSPMGHSDTVQIKKETDGYVEIEQKIGDSEKGRVYLGGIHYFCISKGSLFESRYKRMMSIVF